MSVCPLSVCDVRCALDANKTGEEKKNSKQTNKYCETGKHPEIMLITVFLPLFVIISLFISFFFSSLFDRDFRIPCVLAALIHRNRRRCRRYCRVIVSRRP